MARPFPGTSDRRPDHHPPDPEILKAGVLEEEVVTSVTRGPGAFWSLRGLPYLLGRDLLGRGPSRCRRQCRKRAEDISIFERSLLPALQTWGARPRRSPSTRRTRPSVSGGPDRLENDCSGVSISLGLGGILAMGMFSTNRSLGFRGR
jgi:hypothetical protein